VSATKYSCFLIVYVLRNQDIPDPAATGNRNPEVGSLRNGQHQRSGLDPKTEIKFDTIPKSYTRDEQVGVNPKRNIHMGIESRMRQYINQKLQL
jgi:hypothetical protein